MCLDHANIMNDILNSKIPSFIFISKLASGYAWHVAH